MSQRKIAIRFGSRAVFALMTLAACQSKPPAPAESADAGTTVAPVEPTPLGRPQVGGRTTLATDVATTQLALTPQAGGFSGGYRTHKLHVVDGIVEMTAVHHDLIHGEIVGGTATLETTSIGRGDDAVGNAAIATRQIAPDTLAITRGAATEQVVNREDGIEQAWAFAQEPAGDGDLVVEVAVGNAKLATANDSGLHFTTNGGLGFKYSHAVWRDATGTEFPIQVTADANRIKIVVPEGLLQDAQYPATLDPTVTGEVFTDSPAIGQVGADGSQPDVASDGTNYMVVWQDRRDSTNDDIWASRVSAAGAILDNRGIKIDVGANVQAAAKVAYVGNGYVVAYENHVAAGNSDVVAAFVSTAGVVTPLGTIAGTAANEVHPAIASHGSNALLVWQSGTDISAALYNGTSFGAAFVVANTAASESEPAVASDGSGNYLVTFTKANAGTGNDIVGQLVSSAGALSGGLINIDVSASSQLQSAVDFDGTNFIVVYNALNDIDGRRVSAAGVLVDATAKVITAAADVQSLPDVSCTATGCFVIWQDRRNVAASGFDVYGAAVASDLSVTTADIIVSNARSSQQSPAIGLAGSQWFAAWTDQRDGANPEITGTRISSAGAITDANGIVIASGYSRHQPASSSSTPTTWSIFFADSLAGYDIKDVRFNTNGAQMDATPKVVSSAANAQLSPSAAYVGSNAIVTWQDFRGADADIYAARVSTATGLSLDGNGFVVTAAAKDQSVPKIASSGNSALAVWVDTRNVNFDIYGAVIDQAGTITVADIPICTGVGNKTRPSVGYDSTNNVYLVVWADPTGNHINGARVSTAGALLDANCGVNISGNTGAQGSPRLGFSAGQFFVAWEDTRTNPSADIYGTRVKTPPAGIQVLDASGVAVRVASGIKHRSPAVTGLGGQFIVVWSDGVNLATTGMDIYSARVGATGVPEASFLVSSDAGDEISPDVTGATFTSTTVLVQYIMARPDLDSQRIQVRRITFTVSTQGQPCSTNAQCTSGFCSDSVCCDTACGGSTTADCQACSVQRGATANGTCTILKGPGISRCRNYADLFCDVGEYCDGVTTACPVDVGKNQGLACTKAGGGSGVCPSNTVGGAPHVCQ